MRAEPRRTLGQKTMFRQVRVCAGVNAGVRAGQGRWGGEAREGICDDDGRLGVRRGGGRDVDDGNGKPHEVKYRVVPARDPDRADGPRQTRLLEVLQVRMVGQPDDGGGMAELIVEALK